MALPGISQALLQSYERDGGINRADRANLPSKPAVARLMEDLLALLFPGFHSPPPGSHRELIDFVEERLARLHRGLTEELRKTLGANEESEQAEEEVAQWFLARLPETRERLATDVDATFSGDPAAESTEEVLLAYPGVEAIATYRLAHLLYRRGVPLLPRMMTEWAHSRTGIDIHPGAEIGPYFFIDHGTGIVIGETCRIGRAVKIYHGVTLGARSTAGGRKLRGSKRHPTIEDYVTIYPGATILGGETVIGAHSVIGGNVWLTEPVPPYSVVTLAQQEAEVRKRGSDPGRSIGA
ncbi:serine O-acetyltransferase [Methylacidimicrobium cyclopophantes]|uniref:Serine acetyltransferase n=1 Tax=Methylacidimicrobium cyclopophantes TaxID=1041766 RepID=A0A5E6MAT5_9BACT|nr:serine O-acetyltransferase EpsC [Methylacidimicrobium cyclopophantes]VVM05414.1 serine O-acetyltransferase [Methylacidimicrobium cyclopophantes]